MELKTVLKLDWNTYGCHLANTIERSVPYSVVMRAVVITVVQKFVTNASTWNVVALNILICSFIQFAQTNLKPCRQTRVTLPHIQSTIAVKCDQQLK